MAGPARQDRRVIFAAAVRADATGTGKRAESGSAFDGREVAGEIERRPNRLPPTPGALASLRALDERAGDADR